MSLASFKFGSLDSTLNYLLKYLEGDHDKGSNITKDVRDKAFRLVKAGIAWKRQPRSKQEVDEFASTLNKLVGEVVSRL